MRRDIDDALRGWPYEHASNEVAAREVRTRDGRTVVQIRIDLGLIQMELEGRPDGARPRGFATYLDYLRNRARRHRRRPPDSIGGLQPAWAMSREHCAEADRELVQFYHRRVALLSLQYYEHALRDADHSLALMDFIAEHGPDLDYVLRHEKLRGGVLFDRAQASAALALEGCRPEAAIEAIHDGIKQLDHHRADMQDLDEPDEFDPDLPADEPDTQLTERLRRLEFEIRNHFEVAKTLREQLDEAVEREDYEGAARLRDQIREQSRH